MAPRKYTLGKRAAAVEGTRRRIVKATFDLHGEKGVLATSVQDIARRADVSVGTVYYHFPSVDDLVEACGELVVRLADPPTPDIFTGARSVPERIAVLTAKLLAMHERTGKRMEMARCEVAKVPALAGWMKSFDDQVRELARQALGPDARDEQVAVVLALTDFYTGKALAAKGVPREVRAGLVTDMLLSYLGIVPGTSARPD